MKTTRILTLCAVALMLAATAMIALTVLAEETDATPPITPENAVVTSPDSDPDPDRPGMGWRARQRCCGGCGGAGPRSGGQAGQPGSRCQGRGPDLSALTTITGTVMAYDGGPGRKMPTLTVAVEDEWLDIFVGPNRAWRDVDFRPDVGQELEVTYAPALSKSHLVAISVTDPATDHTVTLRDPETGFPAAGHGRGCCRHG